MKIVDNCPRFLKNFKSSQLASVAQDIFKILRGAQSEIQSTDAQNLS